MMQRYTATQLLSPQYAGLVQEIESLLTLSFTNDPIHKWLFFSHSDSEYIRALQTYFRFLMRLSLLSDASVTVIASEDKSSPIRAVSVLIPPHGHATFDSTISAIRSGVIGFFYQLGFTRVYRLMGKFLPNVHKMHDEIFPDNSAKHNVYLLMFIGSRPDCKGQGLGRRLLLEDQAYVSANNAKAAEEAAAAGKEFHASPFYLESSSANSKRLYERVGFEHRATMTYGEAGEDDIARIAQDGKVLGGKQFAMFWFPPTKVADRETITAEGPTT